MFRTGIAFNWNGTQIAASYSGQNIYTFDINKTDGFISSNFSKTSNHSFLSYDFKICLEPDEPEQIEQEEEEPHDLSSLSSSSNSEFDSERKQELSELESARQREREIESEREREKEKEKETTEKEEIDNSFFKKYKGHSSVRTVKEVNFFGPRSEYLISGSDDGRIFIWNSKTCEIIRAIPGNNERMKFFC